MSPPNRSRRSLSRHDLPFFELGRGVLLGFRCLQISFHLRAYMPRFGAAIINRRCFFTFFVSLLPRSSPRRKPRGLTLGLVKKSLECKRKEEPGITHYHSRLSGWEYHILVR
jgi:hypothetical protein